MGIASLKKWVKTADVVEQQSWTSPLFSYQKRLTLAEKEKLYNFACLLQPYINLNNIKIRVERDTLSLYLEDNSLIDTIVEQFSEYLTEVWQPSSADNDNLLKTTSNIILCRRLPFNNYGYKVTIKFSLSDSAKTSFYNWYKNLDKTENRIKFPPSFEEYLIGDRLWTGCNYFYIKDEADILFISMLLDKNILKIEKYLKEVNILSNKDNIDAGTEQTI